MRNKLFIKIINYDNYEIFDFSLTVGYQRQKTDKKVSDFKENLYLYYKNDFVKMSQAKYK